MNKLIALLLSFFLTTIPCFANQNMGCFVAVIGSYDLNGPSIRKYKPQFDYFTNILYWCELENKLVEIRDKAGDQTVFLDFAVHGGPSGLQIALDGPDENPVVLDNASFGYVVNRVEKVFRGRKFILCFESCQVARAYKNTIRGERARRGRNAEEHPQVPNYPIYGTGDGFNNAGLSMFIQARYNFKRWWINLVDYDSLGNNKQLGPIEPEDDRGYGPTTEQIHKVEEFFIEEIP